MFVILEDVLGNFYVPFARQVNESYSDQEKKLLTRIIRLLTFGIKGYLSEPCLFCKSVRIKFIQFFVCQYVLCIQFLVILRLSKDAHSASVDTAFGIPFSKITLLQ